MNIRICLDFCLDLHEAELIFFVGLVPPEPVYSLYVELAQLVRPLVEGVVCMVLEEEGVEEIGEPRGQSGESEGGL